MSVLKFKKVLNIGLCCLIGLFTQACAPGFESVSDQRERLETLEIEAQNELTETQSLSASTNAPICILRISMRPRNEWGESFKIPGNKVMCNPDLSYQRQFELARAVRNVARTDFKTKAKIGERIFARISLLDPVTQRSYGAPTTYISFAHGKEDSLLTDVFRGLSQFSLHAERVNLWNHSHRAITSLRSMTSRCGETLLNTHSLNWWVKTSFTSVYYVYSKGSQFDNGGAFQYAKPTTGDTSANHRLIPFESYQSDVWRVPDPKNFAAKDATQLHVHIYTYDRGRWNIEKRDILLNRGGKCIKEHHFQSFKQKI